MCLISHYNKYIESTNTKGNEMTKTETISQQIMIEIAATGSIKSGFDKVMGEGAFDRMAGEIYGALRANQE